MEDFKQKAVKPPLVTYPATYIKGKETRVVKNDAQAQDAKAAGFTPQLHNTPTATLGNPTAYPATFIKGNESRVVTNDAELQAAGAAGFVLSNAVPVTLPSTATYPAPGVERTWPDRGPMQGQPSLQVPNPAPIPNVVPVVTPALPAHMPSDPGNVNAPVPGTGPGHLPMEPRERPRADFPTEPDPNFDPNSPDFRKK